MTEFKREDRYIVIKITDLEEAAKVIHDSHLESLDVVLNFVQSVRRVGGKRPFKCVVVEDDWPEYELTWKAIENRVTAEDSMECSNPRCRHGADGNCQNPAHKIKNYRKKGVQPMRPYVPGEDLTGVSVSEEDTPELGGMIAIGKDNGAKWYVSKSFFEENYVESE